MTPPTLIPFGSQFYNVLWCGEIPQFYCGGRIWKDRQTGELVLTEGAGSGHGYAIVSRQSMLGERILRKAASERLGV